MSTAIRTVKLVNYNSLVHEKICQNKSSRKKAYVDRREGQITKKKKKKKRKENSLTKEKPGENERSFTRDLEYT